MQSTLIRLAPGLLLLAMGLPAGAQESADRDPSFARPIFGPTVIHRPGSYQLARNIHGRAEGATNRIVADDVSLDLAGHALLGPGGRAGTAIEIAGADNVRVSNGAIQHFGIGVHAQGVTNLVIEGLRIDGLDLGGPPPGIEIGILLVDTRGAVVTKNTVTDTFLGIFVRGEASGGNRIGGNLLTGGEQGELGICYNPAPGAPTGGPQGDLVYDNVVSRWNRGLAFSADSRSNVVRENTIAYFALAIEEATAGSNLIADNDQVQLDN